MSESEGEAAELSIEEVFNTIRHFASRTPARNDPEMLEMQAKCLALFNRDTVCEVVPNTDGSLCAHYPPNIIVPTSSLNKDSEEACGNTNSEKMNADTLHDLFTDARFARTRSRFVCPVILHRGKWICRSATLARQVEITARQAGNSLSEFYSGSVSATRRVHPSTPLSDSEKRDKPLDSVDVARNNDIALLQSLGVRYICDLMVEDRKVKYGIQLTSSEKVDKHSRYKKGFDLVTMPYPGCELFTQFRDLKYCGSSVRYNWDGEEVNAALQLPTGYANALGINWAEDYRKWDLISITQNYMMLLLEILRSGSSDGKGGLLIHCISGWDRTPLFVSLLRISLWADGEIHQSLSAIELLYLTLTYDWILFGHSLSDRVSKGEEIMLFCFDFLKFITADKFSYGYSPEKDEDVPGLTQTPPPAEDTSKSCASDIAIEASSVAHSIVRAAVTEAADTVRTARKPGGADLPGMVTPAEQPAPDFLTTPQIVAPPSESSRPINIVRQHIASKSIHNSPDSLGSWNVLSASKFTDGGSSGSFTETQVKLSDSPKAMGPLASNLPDNGGPAVGHDDVFDGTNVPLLDDDEPSSVMAGFDDSDDDFGGEGEDTMTFPADKSTSGYASSEDGGGDRQSQHCSGQKDVSGEDEMDARTGDDGTCKCEQCTAHARDGVAGAGTRSKSRECKLLELRSHFLPMYRRCTPQCDEGSWAWMAEMTRLLPGAS
eukprot:m.29248 g.29248  ORF g.29248 m.29248 type:complete len:718 (-) comp4578_c0_seq2:2096-4249(-)